MPYRSRLSYWRNARGYSQDELARWAHVSQKTISNWETGYSYPRVEQARRLAGILDVSTRELFPDIAM